MNIYRLERRLSHADVDFLGELKTPALLGLLEQAAVEASTAAGYDAARYTREGRIWIIRRTRVERLRPVGGTDTVTVETRVVDFRRARSLRRYDVRRNQEDVVRATTDWVYCDLASGRPARVPEELQRAFLGTAAGPPLPRADSLRIEAPPAAVEITLAVRPSALDHVAHVNNTVYVSYLEDGAFELFAAHGWPLQRMLDANGALRMQWLDVEYLTDAAAGERLTVRSWLASPLASHDGVPTNAQLLQTVTSSDGTGVVRAQTDWIWRRRPAVVGGVPD